jgi:hypothetical protein
VLDGRGKKRSHRGALVVGLALLTAACSTPRSEPLPTNGSGGETAQGTGGGAGGTVMIPPPPPTGRGGQGESARGGAGGNGGGGARGAIDAAVDGPMAGPDGNGSTVAPWLRVHVIGGGVVKGDDGNDCSLDCLVPAVFGATMVLTPDTRDAIFVGWSGDCSGTGVCRVTIDRDPEVTATFKPAVVWERRAGAVKDLVVVSDGYVVTGSFRGETDFGGTTLTANGEDDLFVAKYTTQGDLVWVTGSRTADHDFPYQLAVAPNGEVFVIGNCNGGKFQIGSLTVAGTSAADCSYMVRLSRDGAPIAATKSDRGYAIAIGSDGQPVVGTFAGNAGVVKMTPEGRTLWKSPASLVISTYGLELDAAGNAYVCGYLPDVEGLPEYKTILARLSSSGAVVWKTSITTTGGYGNCDDLMLDARNDVYIWGHYSGTIQLGSDAKHSNATDGYQDNFIAKFSGTDGRRLWAHAFVGSSGYQVAIAPDAGNALYAFFSFDTPVDFGEGPLDGSHLVRYDATTGVAAPSRVLDAGLGPLVMRLADSGDLVSGVFSGLIRLSTY